MATIRRFRAAPVSAKLTDVDNAIVACRGRGHKWPDVVPGRKLPAGFRPVLQRDGCVRVTETCQRCGKRRSTTTLPDGIYDASAIRSYANPPGWKVFRMTEQVTRRDFEGETYRRLMEDIMAAARNNAFAAEVGDE